MDTVYFRHHFFHVRTREAANSNGNSVQVAPQSASEKFYSDVYPACNTAFWNSLTKFIDFWTTSSIIGHMLPLSTGLKKWPRFTVVSTVVCVLLTGKELEARGFICRQKLLVDHMWLEPSIIGQWVPSYIYACNLQTLRSWSFTEYSFSPYAFWSNLVCNWSYTVVISKFTNFIIIYSCKIPSNYMHRVMHMCTAGLCVWSRRFMYVCTCYVPIGNHSPI